MVTTKSDSEKFYKMVDELEELEDLDMEEEVSETEHETIKKNEQSEKNRTILRLYA